MIQKLFLALFLLLIPEGPDKTGTLSSPLDIPLVLSANFGEPRADHFHSGVDFKTDGVTGKRVYTATDGYVYRIVVSPTGFGKALYIRHKNGLSTVYGHLSKFRPEIEMYVKENQYARQSFSVNLFPDPGKFAVREGDIIGYSGNSGSSMGPHLHFEVRRSSVENPLDPVQFYDIEDNIKPVIRSVVVYPVKSLSKVNGRKEKHKLDVSGYNGKYTTVKNIPVLVYGAVGFGIDTYDFLNNSWNKCGVKMINLRVDDKLIYSHSIDEFAFSETRYINSHIDYEEHIRNNFYIQKTFLEPNNKLSIYNHAINNGIIEFNDQELHEIEISVSDFNNNCSTVNFFVRSVKPDSVEPVENQGILMPYGQKNEIRHHDIRLSFPTNCFYDSVFFNLKKAPADNNNFYSDLHFVHDKYTPVHKYFEIAIQPNIEIDESLKDKLCLVYIDEDEKESVSYAGGEWAVGFIEESVRTLGIYAISIDTIPPLIQPIRFANGATLGKNSKLRIQISDEFSGISEYVALIDGKWALFEWDPKNSLLTFEPDPYYIRQGGKHTLELNVKDNRDNESVLNLDFYW